MAPAPRSQRTPNQRSTAARDRLRPLIQQFIRSFGLLAADQTPCGMPLATSHAHALLVLVERGRREAQVTQQHLGHALGIDKSNVTRLCAKMEEAGHVLQSRSPTDGRARIVALTTKGARLAERVESASRERFARLASALPAQTYAQVLDSLDALNRAVQTVRALEASA